MGNNILTVTLIALVAVAGGSVATRLAADCEGQTKPCFSWGPGSNGEPQGPYPGYCCNPHPGQRRLIACTAGFTNGRQNPLLEGEFFNNCGRLKEMVWAPIFEAWTCGNVISNHSCGGTIGLFGGCNNVPCGGVE